MKGFIYKDLDQKPRRFLRIDEAFMNKGVRWCRWGESNSHGSLHTPLKRTCLPVPPHRHVIILTFYPRFQVLSQESL